MSAGSALRHDYARRTPMVENDVSLPEHELLERAEMPDGTEFALIREGEHFLVRVAGRALMSSHVPDSEEALADLAFREVPDPDNILVGGLGLGFTLRATLDQMSEYASVTVSELVPYLVEWNRKHLGQLNEYPLDDPRCEVVVENVLDTIKSSPGEFDMILLDVDNGPVALSNEDNGRIYSTTGMRACHTALRPGGILAVWSAGPSSKFERTLRNAHFEVEVARVPARAGDPARHVIFLARR